MEQVKELTDKIYTTLYADGVSGKWVRPEDDIIETTMPDGTTYRITIQKVYDPAPSYRAISPDGFDCFMDEEYRTEQAAKDAIQCFVENYRKQGYYSGMNGRIHVDKVAENCRIVKR